MAKSKAKPFPARHWPEIWPYLLIASAVLIFYGDNIFFRQMFFWRDASHLHLWPPFTGKGLSSNEWLPLWNPFLGGGKPYLADTECAMLYPLNWFLLIMSPARALVTLTCLQSFIFGASTYALGRHWKLMKAPALLGAFTMMFGTLMIAALDSPTPVAAMTWGPLVFLLVSILIQRVQAMEGISMPGQLWRSLQIILLLSWVIAVQFLAGFPQAMLNILLMVGLFIVSQAVFLRNWRLLVVTGAAFSLAGLIAICLCLVQLLPTMEYVKFSERALMIDPGQGMASIYPKHLLTALVPFLFGKPGYPQEYWGGTIFEFWAGTCYIGILPLFMLLLSPLVLSLKTEDANRARHRFLFWFFIGLAVFSLLMATGQYTPVYNWFYELVPGFNHFRWPSKFLQLFMYSTAILSALGMHYLLDWRAKQPEAARTIILAAVYGGGFLFILSLICQHFIDDNGSFLKLLTGGNFVVTPEHVTFARFDFNRLTLFLGLAAASFALLLNRGFLSTWFSGICLAMVFVNLWSTRNDIYSLVNDRVYEEAPDLTPYRGAQNDQLQVQSIYSSSLQFLYGKGNPENALWMKQAASANLLQSYGIFQNEQTGLKLLRWQKLFQMLVQTPPPENDRIADIMSVGYFVVGNNFQSVLWGHAPREISVIRRPSSLPRAYLVSQWTVTKNPDEALNRLVSTDFDPKSDAVVEQLELASVSELRSKVDFDWNKPVGQVEGPIRHTWNSAEVDATAEREAMLVTTETWFPGWKAFVDGQEVPLYRANFNYRGVILKPGRHVVSYRYEPWQFRIGATASLATAALTALISLGLLLLSRGKFLMPSAVN